MMLFPFRLYSGLVYIDWLVWDIQNIPQSKKLTNKHVSLSLYLCVCDGWGQMHASDFLCNAKQEQMMNKNLI